MDACEVTILMPCLNEAETIAACIEKAKTFLAAEQVRGEILVADNGSTDGSEKIARAQGARVISVAARGYGAALKSGILAAQGRYIIMGDADDSYDFLHLQPFLARLREGYDLVMGNRFQGGITAGAMPLLNRYIGNPVLSLLGRIFFRSNIGDFHCGLRGFSRERFLRLDLQGNGMEFASEMIVKAVLNKFNIIEVPTRLYPDGRSRRPHLRPWRDGWRHLRLLLLLSPRWLFLYPGLSLMLLGLLLMTALITGPVEFKGLNLDIHTMLFSGLFMIIGMQAACFAVFAAFIANFQMKLKSSQDRFLHILEHFTLERGLIVGVALCAAGGAGSCYAFWYWCHESFGPLVPTQMMRILIPSVTGLVLGIQLMFSSFFMGILNLHVSRFTH